MPPRTRAHDPAAPLRPVGRRTYAYTPDYLKVLAGNDPDLCDPRTGEPKPTAIALAAGLDRTALSRVTGAPDAPSAVVQASLVTLLIERRGMTEEQAREALFRRVPADVTRRRPAVREVTA